MIKILHTSDTHSRMTEEKALILKSQNADLVFDSGDIIKSGNFGRKDSTARGQQRILISGRKQNILATLFKRYCQNVFGWKKFFKKHKWLLPVGMIMYFFRTSFLIIFRIKKVSIENYKESFNRNSLYDTLFNK